MGRLSGRKKFLFVLLLLTVSSLVFFNIGFVAYMRDENNNCIWQDGRIVGGTEVMIKPHYLLMLRWNESRFIQDSIVGKDCITEINLTHFMNRI